MDRPTPFRIADFPHVAAITTRWMDNDVYGHVNNVVYYSFFDTAVNGYLIAQGVLDIANGATIGLVVETRCNYFKPIAFPDAVRAGLRVAHHRHVQRALRGRHLPRRRRQRRGAGPFRPCLCRPRQRQTGRAAGRAEAGVGENSNALTRP